MSQISKLPNDILVSVLSFLPLKEAGMTSILSKRWRHLWEYILTLNFDASKLLHQLSLLDDEKESVLIEVPGYVHWVDQVVSSHKAPTLDEFRVRFDIRDDIDGKVKNSIDSWIRFSMEKRVKKLTVDLSTVHGEGQPMLCYTYPSLPLFSNNLTSLVFSDVNIAGEVIENFLRNCPALEYLSVSHSDTLVGLKVVGPSLNLKYLRIHHNDYLQQLEISAPNLVSCYYNGQDIRVQYNMPKVVEIICGIAMNLKSRLSDLGCHLSQIEVFKLNLVVNFELIIMPIEYPVFKRLKKLDLTLKPYEKYDLFHFLPLIQACPFLHHLKLQLIYWYGNKRWAMRTCEPGPHYNMKIVEIVGFRGLVFDVEFVLFLIESVVSLDTIILDTRPVDNRAGPSMDYNKTQWRRKSRKRAEQIRAHLKPGTKLVIC